MEKTAEMWEVRRVPAVELEIEEEAAGERLDGLLPRRIPELSRARAKAMIEAGEVLVNGRRVKKSHLLASGDRVTLAQLPAPVDFHATPDPDLQIEVLFENDRYVVVDKPAGVPSHPLKEGETGTLAGALVARYPEMRGVGYRKREPGIVHRLDTDTSGVMLAARDPRSFEALRRRLHAGEIEKRYLARCVGAVRAPAILDAAIANDPRDRRKVRVCTDPREIKRLHARPAITEVLESLPAPHGSLVELRANNARRHQVRAHLASIGHPLLGDPLYGGPRLLRPAHHLLHASYLKIGSAPRIVSHWNHMDSEPVIATGAD
jgi:23S rRNA pseudouridine1911/1915/1917 synthase